ncbi:sterol desaturase family protein [Nocardia blacklockiae]|uniref:sterol desaturase family protein n=1 Tax=Nocardia blacklockiae TaxID=480036 RepID=UPI0018945C0E|nr:sterol desaturase family protein [Nocardia blacklockiae]MBF6172181.1 sterol desaturase family protein [Nocardia blacklockiae]
MSVVDRLRERRGRAAAEVREPNRRPQVTLGSAFRVFARRPSPWIIAAMLAGALAARVAVGDWQPTDALVPVVTLAVFPFVEWVIHVCVLHWRPRRLGPITVDSLLARKHREHHADPRDVPLVFIPWQTFLWLLPTLVLVAVLAFPRIGLGLTFLVAVGALGVNYEWTHYLIHTDYQPRTRLFKAVRRNHRLHHFKNEHYWFTVTTSGTADRVLGTHPDPGTTVASPTVKALHASGAV